MSKSHLTAAAAEIVILQKNLKDLQGQLADAHKRVLELGTDKKIAVEELAKERQLLLELEDRVNRKQVDTTDAIEKQIEDWPEVIDSKPTNSFKPKKSTWSSTLDKEFEDIKPGEWD